MDEIRRQHEVGRQLLAADLADPVRGPIWKQAKLVYEASEASKSNGDGKLHSELHGFLESFANSMSQSVPEGAGRYRLYHALIGSSPVYYAVDFDADGVLAQKVAELAGKYHLS